MLKIKSWVVLILIALLAGACATGPRQAPEPAVWHRKPVQVASLSLRQQVAQLIMVRVEGYYYSADNSYRRDVERWVAEDQVGGLITYRGSVDGTFTNLQRFQRLAPIPLLVAADFERGVGQQIEGATMFPSNMAVAATFDEDNAYQQGRITALEARAMGVHIVFAPVMDVNNNPDNPIINFRAYSDSPAIVERMGTAFIRGAQEHGLVACAKHYPGHGNTATDSHTSLALIPGSRDALIKTELAPFKAATAAGVKMVMVGHIAVPGLDASNRPATQSEIIIEQLLRGEFGFDGLIVTDGMEMGAITAGNWSGEAAVLSIEAGNDMVLLPLYVDQTVDAIVRAVESGRISRERIETSVRRVLKMKADLGLYEERRMLTRESIQRQVGLAEFRSAARDIARKSITLVKDDAGLIPLRPGRGQSLTHILISMDDDLRERLLPFSRNVESTYGAGRVKSFVVNDGLSSTRIKELVQAARSSKATLVTALVRISMDKGVSTIDASHQQLLVALNKAGIPFTVVSFGSPYLPSLKVIPTYLCGYGYGAVSLRAMADAIFGRTDISGKLPVTLDDQHPRGHGLVRHARVNAFGESPTRPDFGPAFTVLANAIADSVVPGAQVFIAQRGQVLADTAFGRFTYEPDAPAVTTSSIYDLASVTKVLVGGTVAMELVDGRYLVLDEPVWHYLPGFKGGGRERVTIRHLLTHSSGLKPLLQFWKLGIKPEQVVDLIQETELDFEPGSKYQYSDLGMILFTTIAEQVTGQSMDRLARQWVFTPLKLAFTGYNPPADWMERIVPTEYDGEIRKAVVRGTVHDENTYFMGGVSAHAGVFSSANQLAKLAALYFDGGVISGRRLVREETVDAFVRPQGMPKGSGRALAWQMASSSAHAGDAFSPAAFGHTGFTGTSIWIDPDRELVVVLFTNRVYPSRAGGGIRALRQQFHNAVVKIVDGGGAKT
ncbi:MAG: serine hydrolase [Candidatus Marinimicrobia bacterium]|nr:serine hydrolase [Candidatus Neomarinimicrobiota bacterium]